MIDAKATIAVVEIKKKVINFQTLKGIRSYDLRVTVAMLYQLSYQSHTKAAGCRVGPLCSTQVRNSKVIDV